MTTNEEPTVKIITNNVPRLLLDSYELSVKEREEFDYLDWDKLEAGEDSATFFRYKGRTYDLSEFMVFSSPDGWHDGWNGYSSDSFFSGVVIRMCADDNDRIVVGTYLA